MTAVAGTLSRRQATVIVAIVLFRRERGRAPSWGELQRILHLESRAEISFQIRELFDAGVRWRRDVPNSLEVRPEALRAALEHLWKEQF
jgi:SOS-response transcriptional repressor LexA